MLKLQYALLASLCLLPLTATETFAATAGVTAAVNQNAKSIPPGGAVRTVVLGANVVQDETIETDGGGLVQILLADGTTFTVGPNSSITIDRFVYDPNANTAQVSATIGRGVFRFIGGRTSKTEGGVQLNTPVGTVGIRGGMADLNFTGAGQIDLLFGNEVTLDGPNGNDRIFQAGYSLIFGTGGVPSVVKTPPGSANFIQQALAGRPGSSGGSSQKPDDGKVAGSSVASSNSGSNLPPQQQIPPPDLRAIELAAPKPNDTHQTAENITPKGPKSLSGKYYGYSAAYVYRGDEDSDVETFYRNIYPSDVEFDFDAENNSLDARIKIGDLSGYPQGTVQVGVGGDAGGSSLYFNDLYYYASGSSDYIEVDGTPATAGNGTYLVAFGLEFDEYGACTCEFMQVGYWVAGATTADGENLAAIGTFAVADLLRSEDYDDDWNFSGTATYEGTALGLVKSGSNEYAAIGSVQMVFNLGARTGTLDLEIDNKEFSTSVSGFDSNGFAEFSGSNNSGGTTFNTNGAFAKNGDDLTAGIIGGFDSSDGNWSASGVYAGEKTDFDPGGY